MQSVYGANHPLVQKVLKGKTPEARAAELIEGTKLKDPEYRKQLAAGGRKDIEESSEPMIELARSIDKEAREARKRYEDEVLSVERTSYGKIARALFETEGTKLYPDATFTLRLSYGSVKGYWENGKFVPSFTTLGGERKPMVNLKTPFNFVSTNDVIGGNSGSPTINKSGELVGLIFDGNVQSLVGNFDYDESVNRSISVDVRGMWEVLRTIFDANEIVDELTKA